MVYSFIIYSDLIYEITAHASGCIGSKDVRINLSYIITKSWCTKLHIQDKSKSSS